MAHTQKVEEEKRRVDNIITLQRGDSQESLEKVSNFYFSPAYIISSFYPFSFAVSSFREGNGEWRASPRGAWRRTGRGPWSATAWGSASAVSPASSLPVQLHPTSELPLRNPTALKAPRPLLLKALYFPDFSIYKLAPWPLQVRRRRGWRRWWPSPSRRETPRSPSTRWVVFYCRPH